VQQGQRHRRRRSGRRVGSPADRYARRRQRTYRQSGPGDPHVPSSGEHRRHSSRSSFINYSICWHQISIADPLSLRARRLGLAGKGRSACGRDATGHDHTPVSLVQARAEELPFADDSFDTVVSTMVLCTVSDVDASLAEITRVLRPGGRLLFIEHVRSDSARLARWQDRLAGPWAAFAEGCRCDRDTLPAIASRMELTRVERDTWKGMTFVVRPLVIGEATV